MKFKSSLFHYIVCVAIVVLFCSSFIYAQPHQLKIGIRLFSTPCPGAERATSAYPPGYNTTSNKVYFGFATGASYCVDDFPIGFAECDTVHEMTLPPAPPSGLFDARWVDSRSAGGACLDQGMTTNIHAWNGSS